MAKILIVEDDRSLLELLRHIMESDGHMPVLAENGKAAMQWLKEVRVDLALLDLMLPDMNGMEICASIKENPRTRGIPVVILTGNDSNVVRIKAGADASADLFLNKPIEPNDLKSAVRKMLDSAAKRKLLLRKTVRRTLDE